jgi:hypothetical protein
VTDSVKNTLAFYNTEKIVDVSRVPTPVVLKLISIDLFQALERYIALLDKFLKD